ncbi:hypothetical protein V6Z11_1Z017100 [Gossypium hirsutum]
MRDKVTGTSWLWICCLLRSVRHRYCSSRKHTIDGRTVEAKRALSREEQQTSARSGNFNQGRNSGGGGNIRTKKIFVGGLPPTLTEDGFRQYFEAYGHVTDVVIMYDQNTQRPRGFGFISFDSEEAVDRVLHKSFHDLNGKQVEVKPALPKDANPGGLAGLWVVVLVVLEVTRDMVLLVGIQVLTMVVWTPITCVARVLELAFHLMVHQDMHPAMVMVLLVMVLVMVVMAIMVVQVLVMVPLPVQLMGIPMLAMQVGLLVPLEVHGALKLHLVMVLWVMGMLLLGCWSW